MSGSESVNPIYDIDAVTTSPAWEAISGTLSRTEIIRLRLQATVQCSNSLEKPSTNCNPSQTRQPCLFNIITDPCETTDVSTKNEGVARKLYNTLLLYKRTLVGQINKPPDIEGANPAKFNNTWSPWLD